MSDFVNYYGANPLNRLSYLRQSPAFLASALSSPKARFVLYNELNPLCGSKTAEGTINLHTVGWTDVSSYIGDPSSLFAYVDDKDEKHPGILKFHGGDLEKATASGDAKKLHLAQPPLVFLGVDESEAPASQKALPVSKPDENSTLESHSPYGRPYWAFDVSALPKLREAVLKSAEGLTFQDMRAGMSAIPAAEAALAGEGRALVDWNKRHVFCSGCGRPMRQLWAGWKRGCIPDAEHTEENKECFSKKGIHNFQYARTDPVVIMGILSPDKSKILLGRQRVWPAKFYSCLAGFIECGETIEEAVRREVYEEAGIEVGEVYYHSSQPWPYPSSLMIGCLGVAKEGQTIRLDLDNELEDAQFFSKEAVLASLGRKTSMTKEEIAAMDAQKLTTDDSSKEDRALDIRMPPVTAIAHTLVHAWANGFELPSSNKAAAAKM